MSLKRTSAVGVGSELEATKRDQVEQVVSSERFEMWCAASACRSGSSLGRVSRSLFTTPVKSKLVLDSTSEMGSAGAIWFTAGFALGDGAGGGSGSCTFLGEDGIFFGRQRLICVLWNFAFVVREKKEECEQD